MTTLIIIGAFGGLVVVIIFLLGSRERKRIRFSMEHSESPRAHISRYTTADGKCVSVERIVFILAGCTMFILLDYLTTVPNIDKVGDMSSSSTTTTGFIYDLWAWLFSSPWSIPWAIAWVFGPGWLLGFAVILALNASYGHFVLGKSFAEPWRWAFLRECSTDQPRLSVWRSEFLKHLRIVGAVFGVLAFFVLLRLAQ